MTDKKHVLELLDRLRGKVVQTTILYCNLFIILQSAVFGQVQKTHAKFTDYRVEQVYRGKPADPLLSKDERYFRTMIRRGSKSAVQFAGHYTIPMWGCGTSCSQFVIVDSVSGKVYDVSLVVELPRAWLEQQHGQLAELIEFHPDSRLLKINGCPNEENCGFYEFLMVDGKGLDLLQKELLPKKFQ